jgi:amidophosphoribosyltransferase
VLGRRTCLDGRVEWSVASEDCAFGPIGFERVRDVQPGEVVVISPDGKLHTKQVVQGEWLRSAA